MNDQLFARPLTDNHTVKCGCTSIGIDSGQPQKCKKSGAFKSQAFITSDMEADDDAHLKPPTNDDDDKETKGGKLLSVAIYSFLPSRNIGTPSVNDLESPCEWCFKAGQECFGWKGWACYNCRLKKIQCLVHIYNRWKCETNALLQSGDLQGTKKPSKGASAEESSCKKVLKQRKTNCTAEDNAKPKDKGKEKAVDKASKFRQQGKFF